SEPPVSAGGFAALIDLPADTGGSDLFRMKISIIGIGRVGGALAIALAKNGYEIENLVTRKKENAEKIAEFTKSNILTANELDQISSEIIFITTQDFEIENAAKSLAENLLNKPTVFHTSGSLSSEVLQSLQTIGCKIGSIHPLVSISDAHLGAERLRGAYFCVEGDGEAVKIAQEIVKDLGGKSFFIETKYKTLYHASATAACGHLVALIDVAIEMLTNCGLSEKSAQEILLPLIKSTVENLSTQTTAAALTGTFARADVETLEKHLEVLQENVSNEVLEVYLQLGNRSAHLAEVQGASAENLKKMRGIISLAKNNLK
ncbi:MAG: DUF2520 domain-containing protein, partial [Acidobacteriota bacterium]|nr:DUF2520 domain-containing protein [Acidobacteriota bacterium]